MQEARGDGLSTLEKWAIGLGVVVVAGAIVGGGMAWGEDGNPDSFKSSHNVWYGAGIGALYAIPVVAAVGLDLADLFPPDSGTVSYSKRPSRPPASDCLLMLDDEAWLVEIMATRQAAGESLSDKDQRELELAASRISVIRLAWIGAR